MSKPWTTSFPSFYRELLQYFQEQYAGSNYEAPLRREFVLWNNKEIMIENKKTWVE